MSRRKAKTWDDITEQNRKNLSDLRMKELEYLDLSGYNKWRSYFLSGSCLYIFSIYVIYFRKLTFLQPKTLLISFGPIIPYGLALKNQFFDSVMYKNY